MLSCVSLRVPLVYGPGVGANFAALLDLCNLPFPLPLGGITANRRSLLFLGYLNGAIRTVLEDPTDRTATFLLSDGEDLSTADLVRRLRRSLNRRVPDLSVPDSASNSRRPRRRETSRRPIVRIASDRLILFPSDLSLDASVFGRPRTCGHRRVALRRTVVILPKPQLKLTDAVTARYGRSMLSFCSDFCRCSNCQTFRQPARHAAKVAFARSGDGGVISDRAVSASAAISTISRPTSSCRRRSAIRHRGNSFLGITALRGRLALRGRRSTGDNRGRFDYMPVVFAAMFLVSRLELIPRSALPINWLVLLALLVDPVLSIGCSDRRAHDAGERDGERRSRCCWSAPDSAGCSFAQSSEAISWHAVGLIDEKAGAWS